MTVRSDSRRGLPGALVAELGEDSVTRDGRLGGGSLGERGLLGVVVDRILRLPLRLKPLDDVLELPADLVREAAEHAVAAPNLEARDAEGIGDDLRANGRVQPVGCLPRRPGAKEGAGGREGGREAEAAARAVAAAGVHRPSSGAGDSTGGREGGEASARRTMRFILSYGSGMPSKTLRRSIAHLPRCVLCGIMPRIVR